MAIDRHSLRQAVIAAVAILLSLLLWIYPGHIQHPHNATAFRDRELNSGSESFLNILYGKLLHADRPSLAGRSPQQEDEAFPYDDTWERDVNIGSWMSCMMNAPVDSITQSKWTDDSELDDYGWSVDIDTNQPTYGFRMDDAWSDLGISGNVASWYRFSAAHDRETTHDVDDQTEIDYPATNALYGNSLNLRNGVIMAESNMGPEYKNRKDKPEIDPDQMVPLKQWSDVVFLKWFELHSQVQNGAHIHRLNHAFRHHVTNKQTLKTMKAVMRHETPPMDWPPLAWPGLRYSIRDEAAKVLMSTPNAGGIAWLLGQHKAQLGIRVVDEVRIFSTGRPGEQVPNLYFHIIAGPLVFGQDR